MERRTKKKYEPKLDAQIHKNITFHLPRQQCKERKRKNLTEKLRSRKTIIFCNVAGICLHNEIVNIEECRIKIIKKKYLKRKKS